MTRFLGLGTLTLALVLLLTGQASAQTFNAALSGAEETPALNTGAVGTAEVSLDASARELAITVRVFNLPTASTAGHIHAGGRGTAGPVIINFPTTIAGRTGDFSMTFRVGERDFVQRPAQGILSFDDAVQAILLGNTYVNIHTTQNPAGEIRGQLTR
jgi:hypothetical protein